MRKFFAFLILAGLFMSCAYEEKKEAITEIHDLSQGKWFVAMDDNPENAKPDSPTAGWQEVELPANLRNLDRSYRGVFWLRRSFDLDMTHVKNNLAITLGKIYERDEVYINGKIIGINGKRPDDLQQAEYAYNRLRVYAIPVDALISGQNVVTIRITSNFSNYAGIL